MTARPWLLDAFCGAGGAGWGYHLAGWRVFGVDHVEQPHYPFPFYQGCALAFITEHGHQFSAIHASPPCQAYSNLNAYNGHTYPDLVAPTRTRLVSTGLPWIIENVPTAPLINPTQRCGCMYGLRLYRSRDFESSFLIPDRAPDHRQNHTALCVRNGYLPTITRPYMSIHGGKHSRAWQVKACEYMGVPWMTTIREVCEAIPPAYTEEMGGYLMREVGAS